MGIKKKTLQMIQADDDSSNSSSSESDVSMTSDSEDSVDQITEPEENKNREISEDEEEDELIKAIKREREKPRDHPPNIICEDHIVDLSFHPNENLLAVASITGDVLLYKYTNEENTLLDTYELHLRACRDIEFNKDGSILFSTAKDRAIMLTDTTTGKLIKCYETAHEVPVYSIFVVDENLLASGDDDGVIKLWDLREKNDKFIFSVKKNEDYISDIITNEEKKVLLCSSGDGSLTTIDLINRYVYIIIKKFLFLVYDLTFL